MLILIACLTCLLGLATFIPCLHITHWMVRGFDFPRVQMLVFALIILILQGVFLDLRHSLTFLLMSFTLACLLFLSWRILPFTRLWRREVVDADRHYSETAEGRARQVSILTSNVLMHNENYGALLALVDQYKPDVLLTLETNREWEQQLEVLERTFSYTLKCPLDNLYGMHLYSRLPLAEEELCFLVEDDVPSMHATLSLPCGEQLRAHFLHPAPPSPTENSLSAERDAELIVVAKSVADSSQPVIVTGDLNDVAWSPTTRLFRKISGLLDPRVGRGLYNTFHADYPLLRWPLDHMFHSRHFQLLELKRLPSIGSDHFPLFTRLLLAEDQSDKSNQAAPSVPAPDDSRVEELPNEMGVSEDDVPRPGES